MCFVNTCDFLLPDGSSASTPEMAQHDIYRTVVCSEEGLRRLSQKLSNMSVTTIGHSLGLPERVVQNTEEDRFHDGTFKMYLLLVQWRNGQEQPNWGMLADCLQHLNDDSLMEEVRQIASEGESEICACIYRGPLLSLIYTFTGLGERQAVGGKLQIQKVGK